jgi:hypothetical protein
MLPELTTITIEQGDHKLTLQVPAVSIDSLISNIANMLPLLGYHPDTVTNGLDTVYQERFGASDNLETKEQNK